MSLKQHANKIKFRKEIKEEGSVENRIYWVLDQAEQSLKWDSRAWNGQNRHIMSKFGFRWIVLGLMNSVSFVLVTAG